jgi:hypothetical protein
MQSSVLLWGKNSRYISRVMDVPYVRIQPAITDIRIEIRLHMDTRAMSQGEISFIGTVDTIPNQQLATVRPFVVWGEGGQPNVLVHCSKFIVLMGKFIEYTEMKSIYNGKSMIVISHCLSLFDSYYLLALYLTLCSHLLRTICQLSTLTWYSLGTHLVLTWYSLGTHLVLTWYSLGTHLVLTWYSPTNHSLTTVLSSPHAFSHRSFQRPHLVYRSVRTGMHQRPFHC